jgi:hypothetical protein
MPGEDNAQIGYFVTLIEVVVSREIIDGIS